MTNWRERKQTTRERERDDTRDDNAKSEESGATGRRTTEKEEQGPEERAEMLMAALRRESMWRNFLPGSTIECFVFRLWLQFRAMTTKECDFFCI